MTQPSEREREWRLEANARKAERDMIVRYIRKHLDCLASELADALAADVHYREAAEESEIKF